MTPEIAVTVRGLTHTYGERIALNAISFEVPRGEIFGLLGPNGGGKTTLFRILTTLMTPSGGEASIFGIQVAQDPAAIRGRFGVVFQEPGLDPKLTCLENLIHHGRFYGMRGSGLRNEALALLGTFGLAERAGDLTETLSGGLRRRVELAKALLPGPDLLFLDEPSTGLDPGARLELSAELQRLRKERGTTVVLTTHFMEEADRCDRVAILHKGNLVTMGPPEELKKSVGGEVVVIQAQDPAGLGEKLRERLGHETRTVDGSLRLEHPRAHELIPRIVEAFPGEVKSLTLGRPTLEDVFIQKTGQQFWNAEEETAGKAA